MLIDSVSERINFVVVYDIQGVLVSSHNVFIAEPNIVPSLE